MKFSLLITIFNSFKDALSFFFGSKNNVVSWTIISPGWAFWSLVVAAKDTYLWSSYTQAYCNSLILEICKDWVLHNNLGWNVADERVVQQWITGTQPLNILTSFLCLKQLLFKNLKFVGICFNCFIEHCFDSTFHLCCSKVVHTSLYY